MNDILNNYNWEIIHMESQDSYMHMAIDQQLLEEIGQGVRSPSLRFWEWNSSSIILGRFQSLKNEVNILEAEKLNIPIVRRISGGGAMFVEPEKTITYSLIIPDKLLRNISFQDSYKYLDNWILNFFKSIGVNAYYKPLNDICSKNGKIGGAAQARRNNAILHHVTISYDMDYIKMINLLRIGKEKLSDKGVVSANKIVDPLKNQTDIPRKTIIDKMKKFFAHHFIVKTVSIGEDTLKRSTELSNSKFRSDNWIKLIP